jgi:hypothetical protein
VKSRNESDLLRISANLRLLLLDGLVHNANRRFKMSIRFTTTYHPLPMKPSEVMWSALDGLYPPIAPPDYHIIAQDLSHFLSKPVAKINKNVVTIKDVIKFEANVKGGVHVGNPKTVSERALENFPLIVMGNRPSLRQLITIGLVTLEALTPLYDAIKS